MSASSLKFGTSGLRGLASELVGDQARRYTAGFLTHLAAGGHPATKLYIGRDLRDSSSRIASDVASGARALGVEPVDCGTLATPALALAAMSAGAPAIMVTGSHIPADRNGLKFYRAQGEISKADEAGILAHLPDVAPNSDGIDITNPQGAASAAALYRARFTELFGASTLYGLKIGLFEHSSVGREALAQILTDLGADVIRLGRSERFVAVDTEAFSDPVFAPLSAWVEEYALDAIVSADGDADRPMVMDGRARFVRGDILGLLTARMLGARLVVTPVTSNSALEASGLVETVIRTRVGSPYVIAEMDRAMSGGASGVIGFEANGGLLVGAGLISPEGAVPALMTRDAVLPIIAPLALAAAEKRTLADLVDSLPLRAVVSDRLAGIEPARSAALMDRLRTREGRDNFFCDLGRVVRTAEIDGLQVWLDDGTMIHYRASGNAPELRCYVEADDGETAAARLSWGLDAAGQAVRR